MQKLDLKMMFQHTKHLRFLLVFFLLSHFAFSQNQVTGVVEDASGQKVPGATIVEKSTTNGVISDIDGNYSISVKDNATLVISFIGFQTQEVAVNGRSKINFTLEEDISYLDEVVVIGYGSIDRADLTTSIASIDQSQLKNLPQVGIDQTIQGRLSGVTVSNNGGQPGGGVSVRVRGITSVNGNEPLYIIDGVPVEAQKSTLNQNALGGGSGQTTQSALAMLNPEDVESIEVLKDAAAQAIYGSRAANGVVLVTTKKGKGEGKLTFNTYFGAQRIPKELPIMNLQENATYINQVIGEINGVTGGSQQVPERFQDPSLLGEGTNWQEEIYQTGTIQNYDLSFSGGTDKTNYFFSAGYLDQTGTLLGTGFERYTLRGNIESEVKPWLTAGFSFNGSRGDQQIGLADAFDAVTSTVLYNSPAAPVRDQYGDYVGQIQVGGQSFGNLFNPVAISTFRDVSSLTNRAFGATYADIRFMEDLSLRTEVNYDLNFSSNTAYQPLVRNEEQNISIITPSKIIEQRNESVYIGWKNYLSYRKTLGKNNLYATLGYEVVQSNWNYIQASRQNLTLNLPSLAAGQGGNDSNESIGAGAGEWSMQSFFARLNYAYNEKYALSATMRADGSSTFGPNNRWGYFPAGSFAWTISNESFAQDMGALNFLKLRLSAGSVGNQAVGQNAYTANVNLVNISPFGNASVPANVGNPNLGWESVVSYDIGLDATLFTKNAIDVSLDLYKKVTTNMLLATQLGTFSGLGNNWDDIKTPITNDGQITNTGIDLSIRANIIEKTDFSWNGVLIFSKFKNNLDYLNTETATINGYFNEYGTTTLVALTQAGQPVGSFYGYVTDGLYTTEEELNSLQTGLDVAPDGLWYGDIKFKDLDDNGIIDDQDVTFIGDPNPDFTLGLTNSFTYKNFDLNIFFYGSFGGDIMNYTRRQTEGLNTLYNNQTTDVLDRYTENNTTATIPRYNQWHSNNIRISDRYIESGTYVRIQNVQLGYTLPSNLASKLKMSMLKVYVSAQNLFTFSNYSGYDPELGILSTGTDANGIIMNVDNGRYPVPKALTFGLNVSF